MNLEFIKQSKKPYMIIFSHVLTKSSAKLLLENLNKINIEGTIVTCFISSEIINNFINIPNIYFLIYCPQMQLCRKNNEITIPKDRFYLYQIEQLNLNLFSYQNVDIIYDHIINSICTFDYSYQNLDYYSTDSKYKVKILQPFIYNKEIYCTRENDILFIGTINDRRKKILDYIKKKYEVTIVEKVTGDQLSELIIKSKIIINIHISPNSIFEIFRIHELLPYKTCILTENVLDESSLQKYKNYIDIFPIIDNNLQNINTLTDILDYKLENYKSENFNTRIDLINSINKENLSILKNNIIYEK